MFTVKASRYMTHMKRLQDLEPALERFYEPLQPLADAGKLGPVVWQLPENFHRDDERLAVRWTCCRGDATRSSSATKLVRAGGPGRAA